MGINSTEVSYGFGQFGSAITDATAPLYPPRGLKIVAITTLDTTTFNASGGLVAELNRDNPAQISVSDYITTEGAGGNVDGEITDTDPHNGNNAIGNGGVTGVVATNANMLTAGVIPGMYVHTTGGMLPHSVDNPFIVKTVTAASFTVTNLETSLHTSKAANAAAVVTSAGVANGANEACFFYSDFGQGVGECT